LLALLEYLFKQDPLHAANNIQQIVSTAVRLNRVDGSCTLTVAAMHPVTGDVQLYYIGDSLYAIFRKDRIEVV